MEPSSSNFKYDAFISYRHIEPDKTIAEKLQRMLEGYKAPVGIAHKHGIKKINRIFRDRDELPTSGNLYEDIDDALANSRCIIVICSPRMPKSLWCRKEIETFRRLHGNDDILALLIEGEPSESFPDELRYITRERTDETGKTLYETIETEPLAADIRANSLQKSLKILKKTERLRLLAPMLGCEFAELTQRQRERRLKRILAVSLISSVVFFAIGALVLSLLIRLNYSNAQLVIKGKEIQAANKSLTKKNNDILANNSKYLANEALSLYTDGDRLKALQVALAALPKDIENPERPIVPEAESALSSIVNSDDYSTTIIHTAGTPVNAAVSPDGKYICVEEEETKDQRSITIWNSLNGSPITTLADVPPGYTHARITDDSKYVIMGNLYWDIATGKSMGEVPGGNSSGTKLNPGIAISPRGTYEYQYHSGDDGNPEKTYVVLKNRKTGHELTIPCGQSVLKQEFFCNDTRLALQLLYPSKGSVSTDYYSVAVYDSQSGAMLYQTPLEESSFYIQYTCQSQDGRWLSMQIGRDMVVFNTSNIKEVCRWKNAFSQDAPYYGRASFSRDGNWLLLVENGQLRIFDWRNNTILEYGINHNEPGQLAISDAVIDPVGQFQLLSDDAKWIAVVADGYAIHLVNGPHTSAMIDHIQLKGHKDVIVSVAFMPDGHRLVTASLDHTVRLWDISREIQATNLIYGQAFPYILGNKNLNIGKDLYLAPTDEQAVMEKYFSGWGSTEDVKKFEELSVRDRATGKEVALIPWNMTYFKVTRLSNGLLAAEGLGRVDIYNLTSGQRVNHANYDYMKSIVAFTSDYSKVVVLDEDQGILSILGGKEFAQKYYMINVKDIPGLQDLTKQQNPYAFTPGSLHWFDNDKKLGLLIHGKLYIYQCEPGSLTIAYGPFNVSNYAYFDLLLIKGDTVVAGVNNGGDGDSASVVTAYDMNTGEVIYKKEFAESITSMQLDGNSIILHLNSRTNRFTTKLIILDADTGEIRYSLEPGKDITEIKPVGNGLVFVSETDGTLMKVDYIHLTITKLSISIQSTYGYVFESASTSGRYICLYDDKNKKHILYDFDRNAAVLSLSHVEDIIVSDDEKGIIIILKDRCEYLPFLDTAQLMKKEQDELNAYQAILTPEERKQLFIN